VLLWYHLSNPACVSFYYTKLPHCGLFDLSVSNIIDTDSVFLLCTNITTILKNCSVLISTHQNITVSVSAKHSYRVPILCCGQ
jgi:hypothetical protein